MSRDAVDEPLPAAVTSMSSSSCFSGRKTVRPGDLMLSQGEDAREKLALPDDRGRSRGDARCGRVGRSTNAKEASSRITIVRSE